VVIFKEGMLASLIGQLPWLCSRGWVVEVTVRLLVTPVVMFLKLLVTVLTAISERTFLRIRSHQSLKQAIS